MFTLTREAVLAPDTVGLQQLQEANDLHAGATRSSQRALFLSAFAALSDPISRAYYGRKRAQQKKHNEALIALARCRTDVLYAMLRDNKPYAQPPAAAA